MLCRSRFFDFHDLLKEFSAEFLIKKSFIGFRENRKNDFLQTKRICEIFEKKIDVKEQHKNSIFSRFQCGVFDLDNLHKCTSIKKQRKLLLQRNERQ